MKQYLVGVAIFLMTAAVSTQVVQAQYTYFPPISGQSAQLHYAVEAAKAHRRADSARRTGRRSRVSKRERPHRRHTNVPVRKSGRRPRSK